MQAKAVRVCNVQAEEQRSAGVAAGRRRPARRALRRVLCCQLAARAAVACAPVGVLARLAAVPAQCGSHGVWGGRMGGWRQDAGAAGLRALSPPSQPRRPTPHQASRQPLHLLDPAP